MASLKNFAHLPVIMALAVPLAMPQAADNEPSRFNGVAFTGLTHVSGKTMPVFLESRAQFPPADSKGGSSDDLLKSITTEGKDLWESLLTMRAMIVGPGQMKAGDGTTVKRLVVIVICPLQASSGGELFKNPRTCAPGVVKALKQVTRTHGEPFERELWSAKVTREIDLDGVVSWWGEVGAAAAKDGTITHVLVRRVVTAK